MMAGWIAVGLSLAALLAAAGAVAQQTGDATIGAEIARRTCPGCHVPSGARIGSDTGPTFADIARRRDNEYLRAFLTQPHPPMPNLSLTRAEIANLIAYIESLR